MRLMSSRVITRNTRSPASVFDTSVVKAPAAASSTPRPARSITATEVLFPAKANPGTNPSSTIGKIRFIAAEYSTDSKE